MFGLIGEQFEVLQAIVSVIAIDVMHDLLRAKLPSKVALDYSAREVYARPVSKLH